MHINSVSGDIVFILYWNICVRCQYYTYLCWVNFAWVLSPESMKIVNFSLTYGDRSNMATTISGAYSWENSHEVVFQSHCGILLNVLFSITQYWFWLKAEFLLLVVLKENYCIWHQISWKCVIQGQLKTEIRACIISCTSYSMVMVLHNYFPFPNFKGGLTKYAFNLGRGWVITVWQ